ncbi:hypothetical protein GCM10010350_05990 [Streptomyces galilaeus]|nr:hypothetical protein GCM10010350_05990 [Streptomyces galilaeus]
MCDDVATLLYLADQACLTLHRWPARAGRVDRPDLMIFDLDPSGDDFEAVREAARQLGELLDEVRLPSALMTTGSRGLHVVVPLNGRHGFDEVRAFARDAADLLAAEHPDGLTTAARKKDRGERLYLDGQRNGPCTDRRRPLRDARPPRRPVTMPIAWEQLDDPGLGPAAGPSPTSSSRPAPSRGPW